MSRTSEDDAVAKLLAGAARVVGETPLCWLVTDTGVAQARPMGFDAKDFGLWRLSFVTDGRSSKAAELRATKRAAVLSQGGAEAFVRSSGAATICEEASEIARRWKRGYDAFFPTAGDRAHAIFVDLEVDRMDLWIRGVTPEPFGMATTTLAREPGGAWRLVGGGTPR